MPIEKRDIAIILGTGAENLDKLGIDVRKSYKLYVNYSRYENVFVQPNIFSLDYWLDGKEYVTRKNVKVRRQVEVIDAVIGNIPVYLLNRHCTDGPYTPAYNVDFDTNMFALMDDELIDAKVILSSSLVGGCRTTDWGIGDKILVRDGVDEHDDTQYVTPDSTGPEKFYIQAHELFDKNLSDLIMKHAGGKLKDGGIYYSGPTTTGARFETKAEMNKLLLPAYNAKFMLKYLPANEGTSKDRVRLKKILDNYPNLVGMTMIREAGRARTFSNLRRTNKLAKFAGVAVISDFPEDEKTDHITNIGIALAELPKVLEIYASALEEIDYNLKSGKL